MIDIIILLSLVLLGYIAGTIIEKKHFKSIMEREIKFREITLITKTDSKKLDVKNGELLSGNVVISIDFFKKFIAGFVNIFGGRMFVYESLLDRARREALLRIKAKASEKGYNSLANVKYETSSISKGTKGNVGSVEVLVYATGVNLSI